MSRMMIGLLIGLTATGCAGAGICADFDGVACEELGQNAQGLSNALLQWNPTTVGQSYNWSVYGASTMVAALNDYGFGNSYQTGIIATNFSQLRVFFQAFSNTVGNYWCSHITSVTDIGFSIDFASGSWDENPAISWAPADFASPNIYDTLGSAYVPEYSPQVQFTAYDTTYDPNHVDKENLGCGQSGSSNGYPNQLNVNIFNYDPADTLWVYDLRAMAHVVYTP